MNSKYKRKIDCVYIDPPYNAKSTEILYKNDYKHSSWLCLIENRIRLSDNIQKENSALVVAINEIEQEKLGLLLSTLHPLCEKTIVTIVSNPSGQQGENFSYTHDYAIFIYPKEANLIGKENRSDENADIRPLRDVSGNENKREDAANCFYPIYIKGNKIIGFGDVCNADFHPTGANVHINDGSIEVYPIDVKGIEKKWVFSRQHVETILNELSVEFNKSRNIYDIIRKKNVFTFKTVWTDKKYSANSYGSKVLTSIFKQSPFLYPKSVFTVMDCIFAGAGSNKESVVLDYFAGSGTTGHAVINLNKADEGSRKYILVEMEEYFDSATKPRIQKVIYSKDWKDGKPVSREGSSHCFKYLKLESYEDTLNNLTLKRTEEQQLALEQDTNFKENYMLSYMLDMECKGSLLNIQSFVHPFDYRLNIASGAVGESNPTKVDLVETFNYLIGLTVDTMQTIHGFRVITGVNSSGEQTLIIWRDLDEKSNQDLEEFFRKRAYKTRVMEFDLIYVNGDNNLENLRRAGETWKVRLIEEDFLRLMFDTENQ